MKKYITTLFTIILFSNLQCSQIEIYNTTNKNIYVAIYYKKASQDFECSRESKIIKITAQDIVKIKRPIQKFLFDRKLLYSTNKKQLKKNILRYEYKFINKKSISRIYGNKFYLFLENDIPICFNYIELNIINPMLNLLSKVKNSLSVKYKKISKYKHNNEIAKVRIGKYLCKEEKKFLKKRKVKVKKNIEKLIDKKLDDEQVPNIAFCLTGGGYRSSIASLGTLVGADEMGLVDSSTYISTLCGSSLPVISWLASKKTLQKYKKIFDKSVKRTIFTPIMNLKLLRDVYERKISFNQPFSVVDLFGFMLADKLLDNLKNKKQLEGLSSQKKLIESGDYPMPIYAAVDSISNYEWLEFTPYEIGSYFLNAYIPTWSFGRNFMNGSSVNYAPELTYSFYMGLFTSAFAWSVKDIFNLFDNCNLCKKAKKITQNSFMDETRLYPAYIPNFTYGMNRSPMCNIKNLKVVDAGFELVIPIPPLLKKERKIDLIIIEDYSTSMKDLPKLEKYAKKFNAPFPKITGTNHNKKQISIFKDKNNPKAPVVIYMPFIKNEKFNTNFNPKKGNDLKFCKNMNFVYNKEQFELVYGLAKQNILDNKEKIINEIKEIVDKKSIGRNI